MSYARQAVTRLTLDMGLPDVQKSISVTRGDTNRRLEVTLIDKGSPFALPPDWTAAMTGVLPGGDELYESCIVDDGRIIFDFVAAPAVSSEEGVFGVSFDVFDEGGEVVASPKLWVHVTAGARRLRDPDTVDKLTALQEFVGQINKVNRELAAHTEQIHDAEEALGTHGERLSGLEDKITATGHITIPVAEWTDVMPYDAFLSIPGDSFTNGDLLLLAPEDNATKEACARARISVNIDALVDEDPPGMDAVWFLRAESGEIPDSPLHFVYFSIRTGADQDAVAAIIGVDAYCEGGGTTSGVDETAVRAIITAMLGNVANERQYSASNPPPYPVTSVNGKTGAVSLTIPSKASDVGADPAGTASSKLITHNVDTASHQDLRLELQRLADRLAAVLDSDDTTLDELSEIVAYIKSNKALIDAITTSKVSVADIIDNLTTNVMNKPLSAAQGVALKTLIDGLQSGKVDKAGVASEVTAQLTAAKQSGEFDGEDGKSAYAYAQDGGYAGTEEEFGEKLAVDTTPFIITVTGDADSGYTVDKTCSEIYTAYNANRPVVCNLGNVTNIPLSRVSGSLMVLGLTFSFAGFNDLMYHSINITLRSTTDNCTVKVVSGKYGAFNPLTINGITYDGSIEVSMNTTPLVVEITMDESTGEWVSTHSADTIVFAYLQGRLPICSFDGMLIPFVGYDDSSVTFALTVALGEVFLSFSVGIDTDDAVVAEIIETPAGELVFTVTGSPTDGYTADMSYENVRAAVDAGHTVVCLFNGEMYGGFRLPLAMADDSQLMFLTSPTAGSMVSVIISDSGIEAMELLSDVTIGNQTWDMEGPVDFTDTINDMIDAKLGVIENGSY